MTKIKKSSKAIPEEENEEEVLLEENEEEDFLNENNEEDNEEDNEENDEDDENKIPIDLSQNEIYRGVCTLLEDEDGNNILEYISLLHTEMIGINKSLENLRLIRKDISRLADCAELYIKSSKNLSLEEKEKEKKVVKKSK